MVKFAPGQFFHQVRQEVAKVTWPSRKDTITSTAMVLVMVVFASVFFMVVDQGFAYLVKLIFGLGA